MPEMKSFQDYENLAHAIGVTDIKERPGDATFKFHFIKKEDADSFFEWLQQQETLLGKEFIEKEIEVKSDLFTSPYSIITLKSQHYRHFCGYEKFLSVKRNLKDAAQQTKPKEFRELIDDLPLGVIHYHLLSNPSILSEILNYQTPDNIHLLIKKIDAEVLTRHYEKYAKSRMFSSFIHVFPMLFPLTNTHAFVDLLKKIDVNIIKEACSSDTTYSRNINKLLSTLLMENNNWHQERDVLEKVIQLVDKGSEEITNDCLSLWFTGKQPVAEEKILDLILAGISIDDEKKDKAVIKQLEDFKSFLNQKKASLQSDEIRDEPMLTLSDARQLKPDDPALAKEILIHGLASYEDYHQLRAQQSNLPKEISWVLDALSVDKTILTGKGEFYAELFFYALDKNSHDSAEKALTKIKEGNALAKIYRSERWDLGKKQLMDYQHRPVLRRNFFLGSYKYDHLDDEIKLYSVKEKNKKKSAHNDIHYDSTKKTPTTALSPELHTPLFITLFDTNKDEDHFGLLFDDTLCDAVAYLREDRGTVMKLWIGSFRAVKQYRKGMNGISYTDEKEFKDAILHQSHTLNEVLAKLRREALLGIIITKDSPRTRALAFQRQAEIKKDLNMQVPIFYYESAEQKIHIISSPCHHSLLAKTKELYQSLGVDKKPEDIQALLLAVIAMDDFDSFKYLLSYLPKEYYTQPVFKNKNTLLHEVFYHLCKQPSSQAVLMAQLLLNRDDVYIDIKNDEGETVKDIIRKHKYLAPIVKGERIQNEVTYYDLSPKSYQKDKERLSTILFGLCESSLLMGMCFLPSLYSAALSSMPILVVGASFLFATVPVLGLSVVGTLGIGVAIAAGIFLVAAIGYGLTMLVRKYVPRKYFNPLNLFKRNKAPKDLSVFAPRVRDELTDIKALKTLSEEYSSPLRIFKEDSNNDENFKKLAELLLKNLSIDEITQKIDGEFFLQEKQEISLDAHYRSLELKNIFQNKLDQFIVENKVDVHKWQTNVLRQRNISDKTSLSEADVSAKEILRKVQRDVFKTEYRSGFFNGKRVALLDSQEKFLVKKIVPKEVKSALDQIEKTNQDEASSWSKTLEDVSQVLCQR